MYKKMLHFVLLTVFLLPLLAHGATVALPETGQTVSYATGDDGDLQAGVAWPSPRFADNGDGTVGDNLTGLIWLKNANCFGSQPWSSALGSANALASGSCGLNDGSATGDWRLPNRRELASLVDRSRYNPVLPTGHPFTGVQSSYYWSSSTKANGPNSALIVSMWDGIVCNYDKTENSYYVWPVRGGQSLPLTSLPTPALDGKQVSGAVFFDINIPVSSDHVYTNFYLQKAGTRVAQTAVPAVASMSEQDPARYLGRYGWNTMDGVPVSDWSQILNETAPVSFTLVGQKADGSLAASGPFSIALQSSLSASISVQDAAGQPLTFPQPEEVSATFVANVSGGTAPYGYRWLDDRGGSLDDSSYECTEVTCTDLVQDVFSRLATLEVFDAAGNVSYAQTLTYIDIPWDTGNPAQSGSGSRLVNYVDVSNRNLYLSATDLNVSSKGLSFALSRSYNSAYGTNAVACLWRFNLDQHLQIPTDRGGRELQLYRADGREERYFRDIDGFWKAGRAGMFDRLVENSDGSFNLYTKGSIIYRFADPDAGGALTAISDRDGNTLTITKVGESQKIVTDSAGRSYTLDYNGDGLLTKATDFADRFVEYTYDAFGNLTAFQDVLGYVTNYQYNANRQLTAILDARGVAASPQYNALSVAYEANGKVQFVTDAEGNQTEYRAGLVDDKPGIGVLRPQTDGVNNNIVFAIDSSGRITDQVNAQNYGDYRTSRQFKSAANVQEIAAKGLVAGVTNTRNYATAFGYSGDGRGNRTTTTNAKNETTNTSYQTENDYGAADASRTNLNVVDRVTTALNNAYAFTHIDSGKVETVTSPVNAVTELSYDTDGLVQTVLDPLDHPTRFDYNADGTVATVTDAKNQPVSYSYDNLGRVETNTDRRGTVTKYTYDAAGNVLTLTRAYGTPRAATITNTYDANGNLISVRDARGNTRSRTYTKNNQLASESFVVGGVTHTRLYDYDALGRLWRTTNENSHAGRVTFDAGGRKVTDTDALSNTTTYTYDNNGNVLTVTDAAGHVTTYTYDELDRVLTQKDHLNHTVTYRYDAEGHVDQITDAKGQVTRYEYDAAGQLKKVTDAAGGITTATYDAAGNLKTVSGPKDGNLVTYSYDELNRMTGLADAGGRTWSFAYDAGGNLLSSTTPQNKTTSYEYDELDRVTRITYSDSSQVQYGYDLNGNRTSMIDSLGTTSYSYDEANRLSSVTDPFGKTVAYNYDGVGNVTAIVYPGSKTLGYSYDAGERLKDVSNWLGRTTSYSYNPIHQVTQVVNGNGTKAVFSYDNANRLVGLQNLKGSGEVISSHGYTLDANGNVAQATVNLPLEPSFNTGSASMTFDAANRLITAGSSNFTHDLAGRIIAQTTAENTTNYTYNDRDLLTAITGADNYSFSYNGNGNRLAMSKNGVQTRYVLDVNVPLPNVIAETNGAGVVTSYYTYGNGLISRIDAVSGQEYFYHFDPTGNALALTDGSQTVTDAYAYTPYGEVTAQGTTVNPFRYSGRHGVMDDGNGLNYMRARYYQPEIKRFLSLDALLGNVGEPQTLNRYGYVLGDPIGGVDPSGNITLDTRDRLSIPFANSHATLDIDATADLSLVNAGFQAQKDIKVYFLDYDTNHHGYVNGFSSNYSIYTDAVSGLELNGSVMNKEGYVAPSVEGAAGACVSANIDGGMELFGVKIDMDVSKNAGYCAGGAAKIHNDSKYVGYSVSGDIALMLGLGGKLDVRVNKKYWNEKGQQLYHSKSVYETAKWTLYGIKRDIRDAFK